MGGFLAGIYAAKYSSLLSSLVLICPAGVKAPRLSEYIMEVANGRKNYLLPKNPDDFRFMLKKISHRDVFIPFFVINIMSAARQSAHEFYEKGKYLRENISVPLWQTGANAREGVVIFWTPGQSSFPGFFFRWSHNCRHIENG